MDCPLSGIATQNIQSTYFLIEKLTPLKMFMIMNIHTDELLFSSLSFSIK